MPKVLSVESGIKGNRCMSTVGGKEERSIDNERKRLEAQSAGSSAAYCTGSQLRVSGLSQRCFESTSCNNVQMMYGRAARCAEG